MLTKTHNKQVTDQQTGRLTDRQTYLPTKQSTDQPSNQPTDEQTDIRAHTFATILDVLMRINFWFKGSAFLRHWIGLGSRSRVAVGFSAALSLTFIIFNFKKVGLDFRQGGLDLKQGGLDLWQVGKIIKEALSAAPGTSNQGQCYV